MATAQDRYRAQAERDMDIPDRPYCYVCDDTEELPHPRWGSHNCPEPTIPCPNCTPSKEYS